MDEPRKGPPPYPTREPGRAGPPPIRRASEDSSPPARPQRARGTRIALSILYWLAVLIVSLAILVGLILLLESRDNSEIQSGTIVTSALRS
jgi:hypothetical protein